jgi:hypothetical protein
MEINYRQRKGREGNRRMGRRKEESNKQGKKSGFWSSGL